MVLNLIYLKTLSFFLKNGTILVTNRSMQRILDIAHAILESQKNGTEFIQGRREFTLSRYSYTTSPVVYL